MCDQNPKIKKLMVNIKVLKPKNLWQKSLNQKGWPKSRKFIILKDALFILLYKLTITSNKKYFIISNYHPICDL